LQQRTLNMNLKIVIKLTLIAQDMLIMLKT